MTIDIILDLGTFLISVLCGFVFIPLTLNFCKTKGLYDIPNQRKLHHKLIPRLGGITFIPSMVIAALIAIFTLDNDPALQQRVPLNLWSILFFFSLAIIYVVGIIDDLVGLGAKVKFAAQVAAAVLMPVAGLSVNNLYGFCGIYDIPLYIGIPLTVFVIVFISNAINLIDGIDGLAAGLSFIALIGFFYGYAHQGLNSYGIIISGLAGVLIPYLYFNILGKAEKNRKIFMGDSGSLTLGFILGFLFVKFTMVNGEAMPYNPQRMLLAYSLLIVPVFDVVRVILHRLHYHAPLFKADKSHIHHKLMRAGCTMHQALAVIITISLAYLALNFALYSLMGVPAIIVTDVALYTLFNIALNSKIKTVNA